LAIGSHAGQAQTATVGAPTQGQLAYPAAQPLAAASDNNNAQAAAKRGPVANPAPGTVVVRINGRVQVDFASLWSSADTRFFTAPTGSPGATPLSFTVPTGGLPAGAVVSLPTPSTGAVLGVNGTGVVKTQPLGAYGLARLYLGADGMATNGLRYGAGVEIRENFAGNYSGQSPSAYSSTETLFVRRAFTYVAGDNWGIVRAGQADGIISLFDNGVTTFQYLPTSNLQNGEGFASRVPANTSVPFAFLSGAGVEYTNTKLVYLSPQFFSSVDFGAQYAPNQSNGYGSDGSSLGGLAGAFTGSGIGTGVVCNTATTGCPNTSAAPGVLDGSRILNQTAIGARYQGAWGSVSVLAYAVWEISGRADYTGATTASVLGNTVAGSKYTGKYDGLNFGSGGLALTYAGFTVGGNMIGGRLNGQLALAPQNAVGELGYLLGVKYTLGPFVAGIAAERYWSQGAVNLTGLTQRCSQAIDIGVGYTVAPGLTVYAQYQYDTLYQGAFNFITGAIGSPANNTAKSQGFIIGNNITF
jgi:hypothetical protein